MPVRGLGLVVFVVVAVSAPPVEAQARAPTDARTAIGGSIGGSIGAALPADDGVGTGPLLAATIERDLTRLISTRGEGGFGWTPYPPNPH